MGGSVFRRCVAARAVLVVVFVLVGMPASTNAADAADACSAPANPVVAENCRPGAPSSVWDVDPTDASIQGFATDMSVDVGTTVQFKIDTSASAYRVDIYRSGWYGGNGARLVASVTPTASLPQTQPACMTDGATGLVDCGNWGASASWAVPSDAVSGVYFARPVRTDGTPGASHIPFVVREDTSHSALLFQTSDTTWQAYNQYGGNSLYTGGPATNPGRAYKVSYNRPFTTRATTAEDSFFNAEYPMVRWLERNGYDVSYISGIDTDRGGASLLEQHRVFMSVGHDEYWSGAQRVNVEAARDAGVHLAFFSGNQGFWKTRWETSIDGSSTPYRTLVSYKDTHAGNKIDPLAWTGTWRDPLGAPYGAGRPENSLQGTIFTVNCCTYAIKVPAAVGQLRLWRNTTVAALEGGTATLASGSLGYEWNEDLDNGSRPAGQIDLSSTTQSVPQYLQDAGTTYAPGTATHSLTLHRAVSGALVFDAGTVQWSWGLDGEHDRGASTPDAAMQQATVNLFADMGVQPATLQSGLTPATASTDTTAPTATIVDPASGTTVGVGSPVTVTGTATDTGGGRVGGVEVSTDDGATWHPASGLESWTYTFTPSAPGDLTIRSRATDDSVNTGVPSAAVTITAAAQGCPCSLWNDDTTIAPARFKETDSISVGVKFRSDENGTVTGLRFYKSPGDPGPHTGHLYTADGSLLATAPYTNESASGWQHVTLATPVPITAGSTYVATVFSAAGYYPATGGYFNAQGYDRAPLHALRTTVTPNGVYLYNAEAFPTESYNGSNYWVDLDFSDGADVTPPFVVSRSPVPAATSVPVLSHVTARFSEPMDPATITPSTFELRDAANVPVAASVDYDAPTRTARLVPTNALSPSSSYTAQISGTKDAAGNVLTTAVTWSFMTATPPLDTGPGGPILVIGGGTNPFGRYLGEILAAEGLNEYRVTDISTVTASILANYDVVVLGDLPLNASQVSMLTAWVNGGGKLVAMRPDAQLANLLGVTSAGGTLSNAYLGIDTSTPPGRGISGATLQFHGAADRYNLSGASQVAALYSNATTATPFPAVTSHNVGSSGGEAAAFTYDLARSVVLTRQGNPAWAGQDRDGQAPVRADDLFFGAAAGDPQPDWVDLSKVAIPQADEQQRLLANLITQMMSDRLPLPRFWYFPHDAKAAVVLTGDDHGSGGTAGRFDNQLAASPAGCSVQDWQCVRSTSYVYTNTTLTDAQASSYAAQGFEVALHVNTGCTDWTASSLEAAYASQLADWHQKYASQSGPATNRTHCIAWSDYTTQPHVERSHGIRLDTNYYFWPPGWVNDTPGLFTGSGMPMRFADEDGSIIDVYQAPTQMTDESGQSYPKTIDTLLDNAQGPTGYYGAFTANMHTDSADSSGATAIVGSAQAHAVPVVSAQQMLTWLDARNGSSFESLQWSNGALHFTVNAPGAARGLRGMLPTTANAGATLQTITRGGVDVAFTKKTVKGVEYAFFDATNGDYVANYSGDTTAPVITGTAATPAPDGSASITWTTDEPSTSSVVYGTSHDALNAQQTSSTLTTSHHVTLTGLAPGATYYFRVTSADNAANASTDPPAPAAPRAFVEPSFAAAQTSVADFQYATGGDCRIVAHAGDGEVILAAATSSEFSGSALPSGWESAAWDGLGAATVGSGALTVNGARANTTSYLPVGSSVEFVATFTAERFQHAGLGDTLNDAPWAIFSTGSDGARLRARTNSGGATRDDDIPGSWFGSPHRYRIDWSSTQVVFSIDGNVVATHPTAISAPMRPIVSDAATNGTNLTVDWLQASPFTSPCTYASGVVNGGKPLSWLTLDSTVSTPPNTAVLFETRSSTNARNWSPWVAIAGTNIASPSGRYLQYRATLSSSDAGVTPAVSAVRVTGVDMPPIARAGPDVEVSGGNIVPLDAGTSSDPENTTLAFAWLQVSGPPVTIRNDHTSRAEFTAPSGPNTLTFRVTVTDASGNTSTDDVTVTVKAPK